MKKEAKPNWFEVDTKYVGALDGVRAIAILIVLWFHFWQQSWLMPTYPTPFLEWLGIQSINFNIFRRCGYIMVDLMILLSGFVLYLPYARNQFEKTPILRISEFYLRRAVRIVPSYVIAVLVMFFVALFGGLYANRTGFLWKDLITHLTFTHIFFPDTYQFSLINGVFWTAAIEVWFYLIFPFLAKGFRKNPSLTYIGMVAVGLLFTFTVATKAENTSFMTNQFLTFLPVFANGMLLAHLYVWYAKKVKNKMVPSIVATVVWVAAVIWVIYMFKGCANAALDPNLNAQMWQIVNRYPLSFAYFTMIGSLIISIKPLRSIFQTNVLRFLSSISFNLYLWHQWIMVELRKAFGASSGADIAAMGQNMQWILTVEGLLLSILVATFMTYVVERPLSKLLLKKPNK